MRAGIARRDSSIRSFRTASRTRRAMSYAGFTTMWRCRSSSPSYADAIWDVIADVRAGSPTFGRWQGFYLSDTNHKQLYVPAGFAHGFLALSDDVIFSYKHGAMHDPAREPPRSAGTTPHSQSHGRSSASHAYPRKTRTHRY